ncbi:MAG: hypothetical protein BGO41_06605 [Clostridiales bacterium 38-18]|nr:MAG: hypothetical protein BGO41_06605 [Clostridiales bacterium 38-18]
MKNKRKLTIKEKVLLSATLVLLLVLVGKSVFLDPYQFSDAAEQMRAETFINETFDSKLYELGILEARIVNIEYKDNLVRYHSRKYVFGLLPFGDDFSEFQ